MTISRTARRTAAVLAGSTALALSLGGCYELLIENGNGAGSCIGGDFTLTTSQDSAGSELTITYTGPAEAKLAYTEAFYSDDDFGGLAASRAVTMDNGTVRFVVFDPSTDAGWTISGSGASTTYEFVGTAQELIGARATSLTEADIDGFNSYEFVPGAILVNCDGAITSSPIDTVATVNNTDYLAAPGLDAGAPIFPGHMKIEPFEIVSQEPIDGGIQGTLRFPEGTAALFGDFVPAGLATASLYLDNTDVPNDDFANLWFEALMSGQNVSPSLTITGDLTLDSDIPFTLVGGDSQQLADGDYNALFIIAGTENGRDSGKVVFMTMRYSAEAGLAITDVTGVVDPEEEPEEETEGEVTELADTGVDAGLTAGIAAALAFAGLGLVVARRRTSRL